MIQSQMDASDAVLLGRRTYEEWAAYWPDKTAQDDSFADFINDTQKFVVSTTLKSVDWRNSTLVTGNLAEELAKLKQQPGKDIAISGSVTLVGSLLRDRLLDELSLLVNPVVVGTGKRLFEDPSGQVPLKLEESRTPQQRSRCPQIRVGGHSKQRRVSVRPAVLSVRCDHRAPARRCGKERAWDSQSSTSK